MADEHGSIKMRDEIDGRLWTEHGPEFTAAVLKWIAELSAAFIRMNDRNYQAPWREAESRGHGARPA
jgi:hypothetical protein